VTTTAATTTTKKPHKWWSRSSSRAGAVNWTRLIRKIPPRSDECAKNCCNEPKPWTTRQHRHHRQRHSSGWPWLAPVRVHAGLIHHSRRRRKQPAVATRNIFLVSQYPHWFCCTYHLCVQTDYKYTMRNFVGSFVVVQQTLLLPSAMQACTTLQRHTWMRFGGTH
jgi:hypothetical protein